MSNINEIDNERGPWSGNQVERSSRRVLNAPLDDKNTVEAGPVSPSTPINAEAPEFHPSANSEDEKDSIKVKTDISASKLSASAKEWYPPGYMSQKNQTSNDAGTNCVPGGVLDHVKEALGNLALNPAQFENIVSPLSDVINERLNDSPNTVTDIIDCIIEQSIVEPNLRYTGARLCSFLNLRFNSEQYNFRDVILRKCCEEHKRCSEIVESDRLRVHGFVTFLAELYLQLDIRGFRIEVLGHGLLDTFTKLLDNPLLDNTKCVTQLLKLCGWQLDEQMYDRTHVLMDKMRSIVDTTPDIHPTVRTMILNVLQLRRTNWGYCSPPQTPQPFSPQLLRLVNHASSATTNTPASARGQRGPRQQEPQEHHEPFTNHFSEYDEPVMYGPDGQVISAEESAFLEDALPDHEGADLDDFCSDLNDDEMDDEISAAYEQFLEMTISKSTRPV